jgi:hypothetical protein
VTVSGVPEGRHLQGLLFSCGLLYEHGRVLPGRAFLRSKRAVVTQVVSLCAHGVHLILLHVDAAVQSVAPFN